MLTKEDVPTVLFHSLHFTVDPWIKYADLMAKKTMNT
jgi:hypothetical protein